MKTAMQIAVESYKNDGVSFTDWFMDNYKMLLEKEKKQIIDAYGVKTKSGFKANGQFYSESRFGDEYYDKTYNNEKV